MHRDREMTYSSNCRAFLGTIFPVGRVSLQVFKRGLYTDISLILLNVIVEIQNRGMEKLDKALYLNEGHEREWVEADLYNKEKYRVFSVIRLNKKKESIYEFLKFIPCFNLVV